MPQHLCPRCHTAVDPGDSGTLSFCSACGAPQVRVPQDLSLAMETQETAAPPAPSLWPGAMQIAGLAAGFAALLTLLSAVFPPISFVSFIWAISAPFLVLRLFDRRFPASAITSGFGARLGLLTALLLAVMNSAINVIALLLMRFVFHHANTIDAAFDTTFSSSAQSSAQMAQISARLGSAPASAAELAYIQHIFVVPEFRVGFVMLFGLLALGCYLFYASLAGGLAGFLRSRTR